MNPARNHRQEDDPLEPRLSALPAQNVSPAPAILERIKVLYDQGLLRQAHEIAQAQGPLTAWTGTRAGILAGRLAANLGAPRLAGVMHWRAWKQDRTDIEACAYHAYGLLQRRGPLTAAEFIDSIGDPPADAHSDGSSYLFSLRARIAGLFRDFGRSEAWLHRARERHPGSPWLVTETAGLLEMQDRYEEALALALGLVSTHPHYRPGIQTAAHLLQIADRDDEALDLLQRADERMESGPVAAQLGALQMNLEQFEEAGASYVRYAELSPLMEKAQREWLDRNRITLACHLGNLEEAAALAQGIDEPHYRDLAQRLLRPRPPRRRVRLNVPFVRQHHMTCAPATLSALSRFWNIAAEHLDLAEAICYDGTPAHSERHWAETHGWTAREFTVTWDAALALLQRGLPFTLTTSESTSAHLQAVIGFDELRGTLLLRDPFHYYTSEAISEPFLERYAATGPRGMVLVPDHREDLLDGIELPDAGLYDLLYELQRALESHQRDAAQAILERMWRTEPEHRLTLTAQRTLAGYDANTPALLESLDGLLKLFPRDPNLNLCKLGVLRQVGRREDRLRLLEERCDDPQADSIFFLQYALEWRADGRQREAARYWLDKAIKRRPLDSDALMASADFLWDEGEWEQGTERYRLAACLNDKREVYAQNYFTACRHLKKTDQALMLLRLRWDRHAAKSAQPAITLFDALDALDRTEDALAVLENTLKLRPEDGDLLVFAADACARLGRHEEADRHLQAAEGRAQHAAWLRAAARMAEYRGDRIVALGHWRAVLEFEPLAIDANRSVALALAETESREAALRFLEEACQRFPFHIALHSLWIEWLRDEPPERMEPVLRHMISVNPTDAWVHRELANCLEAQGRLEEGMAAADHAVGLDPTSPHGYCTRGSLTMAAGQSAPAREDFREAIRRSVDAGYAMVHWVEACETLEQREEAVQFIAGELERQTVLGDGLQAFHDAALGIIKPASAMSLFRRAWEARPELWSTWSLIIRQCLDEKQYDEALRLATQANTKFPFHPKLWLDRARVHQSRLENDAEIEALNKALAIHPAFAEASRQLAAAHERMGRFDTARAVLESACARTPLDPVHHGQLAAILWRLDRKSDALAEVQKAVQISPGYHWAWQALHHWGEELGRGDLALSSARELTERRAGEARSWIIYAETLTASGQPRKSLDALDQAIRLNPRCVEAYSQKAIALTNLDCIEEAQACCHPAIFSTPPPELQARAAWIEAQRGNTRKAMQQIKATLADHPALLFGWQLLADWCCQSGEHDDAIQAADRIAALDPLNPVPLGYAGDLKLRRGDRLAARADFQRAFQLDPQYSFAGHALFDLQLEDDDFLGASETLDTLQRHLPGELTDARAGLLAVRTGDPVKGLDILRRLCTGNTANPWSLQVVAECLEQNGQRKAVLKLLNDSLFRPDTAPVLGEVWVRRQVERGRLNLLGKLTKLLRAGEIGQRALSAYVEALSDRWNTSRQSKRSLRAWRCKVHFRRAWRRHRGALRRDDAPWGQTGYALSLMGSEREVIDWLGDWMERKQVESWVLHNLVLALVRCRREDEAVEIIRHGVSLRLAGDTYLSFKTWALFEETVRGNIDAANGHLQDMHGGTAPDFLTAEFILAQSVLKVLNAPAGERRKVFRSVRRDISNIVPGRGAAFYPSTIRRAYARAVRRLKQDMGGLGFTLWLWRRSLGAGWLVPASLAALIAFVWLTKR